MLAFPQWVRVTFVVLASVCFLFASVFIPFILPYIERRLHRQSLKGIKRPRQSILILAALTLILGILFQIAVALPSPSQAPPKDDASFVYDESFPDDTQLRPGESFVKSWRLYNRGETDWMNYDVRRNKNLSTGTFGPSGFRVRDDAPAGHDIILSEEMVAPINPGCYRAVYQLYNSQEQNFGETFDVQIVVTNPQVKDYVLYLDDLNVRDYTLFKVSSPFRKGWRLHNCGTNTWVNYKAKRIGGDLNGPQFIPIPPTSGNQDVAIWADFTAPPTQKSASTAIYQLQDSQGRDVGGVYGQFYVTIKTV
jgi:hypothetical protein